MIFTVHEPYPQMVRYYGFLSNRNRERLLPLVNLALEKISSKKTEPLTYTKQHTPIRAKYQCVLCGNRIVFTGFTTGSKNNELLNNRRGSMHESRHFGSELRISPSKIGALVDKTTKQFIKSSLF